MGLNDQDGPLTDRESRSAAYAELMAYVDETIAETAGWEGELLEAQEVTERHGISAEQLDALRHESTVVAFPGDPSGYRYPATQFVDGAVVPGIDRVAEVVKFPGERWIFLTQRCAYLDGDVPLERLKRGELEAVLHAAHMQYDL